MAEIVAKKLQGYIQQTITAKLPTAAAIALEIAKELTPKLNDVVKKTVIDESEKNRTALIQAIQVPTELRGAQQYEGDYGYGADGEPLDQYSGLAAFPGGGDEAAADAYENQLAQWNALSVQDPGAALSSSAHVLTPTELKQMAANASSINLPPVNQSMFMNQSAFDPLGTGPGQIGSQIQLFSSNSNLMTGGLMSSSDTSLNPTTSAAPTTASASVLPSASTSAVSIGGLPLLVQSTANVMAPAATGTSSYTPQFSSTASFQTAPACAQTTHSATSVVSQTSTSSGKAKSEKVLERKRKQRRKRLRNERVMVAVKLRINR